MKYLFIGGLTSSGTTIVYKVIKELLGAPNFGKKIEGQKTKDYPINIMDPKKRNFGILSQFSPKEKKAMMRWFQNHTTPSQPWCVEKSPHHFTCFSAFQDLLGPQNTYFIVVQRDPIQRAYSASRRWIKGDEIGDTPKKVKAMIDFHQNHKKNLNNFIYVRYEKFLANPIKECIRILNFLNFKLSSDKISEICVKHDIKYRHVYKVDKKIINDPPRLRYSKILCDLWKYEYRKLGE